jgi:hypothetical protein
MFLSKQKKRKRCFLSKQKDEKKKERNEFV